MYVALYMYIIYNKFTIQYACMLLHEQTFRVKLVTTIDALGQF